MKATKELEVIEPDEILEPERETSSESGLATIIDRVLEKGVVINADITVMVSNTELLGIKIRAALASFSTAAKYGLQFPQGTNTKTLAWQEAMIEKEDCPNCGKIVAVEELLNKRCPWCGWQSAKAKLLPMEAEKELVK